MSKNKLNNHEVSEGFFDADTQKVWLEGLGLRNPYGKVTSDALPPLSPWHRLCRDIGATMSRPGPWAGLVHRKNKASKLNLYMYPRNPIT